MTSSLFERLSRVVAVLSLALVGLVPTTSAVAAPAAAAPVAAPTAVAAQATIWCYTSIYWGVPIGSAGSGARGDCYMNSEQANYGDHVKALQRSYNNCYSHLSFFDDYPKLTVDGDYGSRTTAAVRRVQSYAGIVNDGLYGPGTATRMMQWVASSNNGRPVGGECEYYVSARW